MSAMNAYVDDFGKISLTLNKTFYSGKSDSFWLITNSGTMNELIISGIEEHETFLKYDLIAPANMKFGIDYKVREMHGLTTALKHRLIVKTEEFNRQFYYDKEDLGATYYPEHTDFALWAPTAVSVTLQIRNNSRTTSYAMQRTSRGVYRASIQGDLRKATYVYFVERNGEVVRCLDPYALSSTGNGWESAVIDLRKLKSVPFVKPHNHACGVDAVIYETHIRDITSNPLTGTKTNGKYLSLCEEGTTYKNMPTGLDYIASLGVTHVQLMPVHDYVTVDEFHPEVNYNWGYDPMHYLALEGSYSSNPNDPYARMVEFRKVVSTLHRRNMKVTMDVVFNHVYDVESSCFNGVVPFYYFRYNSSGYLSNGSYCGNDFASEVPMGRKYLMHVIRMFMQLYDVDGFRFDLMGCIDVDTMNMLNKTAQSIKYDAMLYGEGWDLPTMLDWRKKSSIYNQDLIPHIGHFNDFFRDVAKGKTSDDQKSERGYITGNLGEAFNMLSALGGNVLKDPYHFRFESPDQTINGIETHDNATAWDKMHFCCNNEDRNTRKKRQKMMLASTLVAQGVPFLHAGVEHCGSKNDNANSYNAGDKTNQMDWERALYYSDMIEYTKKAIQLRKDHPQFRFKTTKEIRDNVVLSLSENTIVFYDINVDDKNTVINRLRVIINPTFDDKYYTFEPGWRIIFDENGDSHSEKNSNVHVPPLTLLVLARSDD